MRSIIDSELVAAMSLSDAELEETGELQVGFIPAEGRFEVVVRYHGDLAGIVSQIPGATGEFLTEQYAILTLTREQIVEIAALPEIEYVEKPKALLSTDLGALRASCITSVQLPETFGLHGEGTLIGIMDSGIDYLHPAFITDEGESRIAALWDQTLPGEDGQIGQYFDQQQITEAIRLAEEEGEEAALALVPSVDVLGHGTQVSGAAAGNGRGGEGSVRGVCDKAELIVVKLAENPGYGFTKTTAAMRALKYIIETAREMQKPVAVNVSMGTNIGGHDGQSLFETYIDDWSRRWINSIVVAAGNEGAAGRHARGYLEQGEEREIEFQVGEGRRSVMLQLWKEYADRFYVNLGAPNGQNTGYIREGSGIFKTTIAGTNIFIYYGEPSPYSSASTIYVNLFAPSGVTTGLWRLNLSAGTILNGRYDIWMTGEVAGRGNTFFLIPNEETTITMPVTAQTVIGVAAYNHITGAIAPFSGRGFSRNDRVIKPDLAAPGVNILTSVPGGGYRAVSGTSIAAPFVAGAAALMMQWGVVQGHDLFLYGERLKVLLITGADRNFLNRPFPNRDWGFGKMCLYQTMQELSGLNLREALARASEAEDVNCREVVMSEDYSEWVFPRRVDGRLPVDIPGIVCVREISNNDILLYLRLPGTESEEELFSLFSWENIPMLYGIAADQSALNAAGITGAQQLPGTPLTGSGVFVGIIDTGIDYLHPAFRYEDGSSKILSIWDQSSMEGEPPQGYIYGQEFTRQQIEEAIRAQEAGEDPYEIVSQRDLNGHGTYVAGVAAGSQAPLESFSGAAPDAELIVVKLKQAKRYIREYYGVPEDEIAFQHTDIQQAVSYIAGKAAGYPHVILLALSATLGPHDGSAELENALNSYRQQNGMVIVCPAGNEGDTALHTSGTLSDMKEVEFFVGEGENTLMMTVWMHVPDQFSVSLVSPRGYVIERIPRAVGRLRRFRIPAENTIVSVDYFQGVSWNGEQAAVIRLEAPTPGLWQLNLYGDYILSGTFDIYMPLRQWVRPDTKFLNPDPEGTVTMPGTANSVLTVGGYNHLNLSLFPASVRGPTREGILKPGITAPAVGVYGPAVWQGYQARSGTSAAAALAAGGSAQLLQWAIGYGNMPDISSMALKTLLFRGADRRAEIRYPNNRWGFGEMNILQSVEKS